MLCVCLYVLFVSLYVVMQALCASVFVFVRCVVIVNVRHATHHAQIRCISGAYVFGMLHVRCECGCVCPLSHSVRCYRPFLLVFGCSLHE